MTLEIIFIITLSVLTLLYITICNSKMLEKGNCNWWSAFIPIYAQSQQLIVMGKHPAISLLFLIPGLNVLLLLYIYIYFPMKYTTNKTKIIGSWFFPYIFLPVVSFGKEECLTPKNSEKQTEKIYLIVGILTIAILGIYTVPKILRMNPKNEVTCISDKGSIVLTYSNTTITNVDVDGYIYDKEKAQGYADDMGMYKYINDQFIKLFENMEPNGTCSIIIK